MPLAHCHACSHEFTLAAGTLAPECPACNSTFIEESESFHENAPPPPQFRQAGQVAFPVDALLAALGMIAPIGANPVGEAGDPGDEAIVDGGRTFAQGQARGGAAGVPLHSLAEYLGTAFGRNDDDYDNARNNPFAEHDNEGVAARPRANSVGEIDRPPRQQRVVAQGTPIDSLINFFLGTITGRVGARANLGDYAIGEAGFDRILTNLLEEAQTNGGGPTPASQDVIASLPRSKMSSKTEMSEDCAICRDAFEEDMDLIELPCSHFFHDKCLILWLNTNGSCPVCRFSLLPDPNDSVSSSEELQSATSSGTPPTLASISGSRASRASGSTSSLPGSYPGHQDDIVSEDVD